MSNSHRVSQSTKRPGPRVLVCAPSNKAVLELLLRFVRAVGPEAALHQVRCQKINRLHAHARDSRTNPSHEHRASNGSTTLDSRSRRRRPQAAAQRCASALEPA